MASCRQERITTDHRGKRGGTLRLATPTDIQSLDPAIAYDTISWPLVRLLFHGLLDYDDGLNLIPWQARDWSVSADKRVYTFHLRPGVKFSNGREVVAEDYVYTLERVLNPKTKSPGAGFFGNIVGATAFQDGKAQRVRGVRAPDKHTFVVTLEQPDLSFQYVMAMPFTYVVPREVAEKYGDDFSRHPVGTGPYLLAEWRRGMRLRFVRNPRYNRRDIPYCDVVDVMIGGDQTLHLMMFERGELDFMDNIPIPDFVRIMRHPRLKRCAERIPNNGIIYLSMNTEMKPFDNLKVRQAMNYAIDRRRLLRLLNQRGILANGVLPPLMPGFNPHLKGYDYNPDKATQLLREAGYADGFSTTLWFVSSDLPSTRLSEAIQEDLDKVGVKVELKPVAQAMFIEAIGRRKNVPLALPGWYQDYPDPNDFLDVLLGGERIVKESCNNVAFYKNPKVDKLLGEAAHCTDPQKRYHLYQQAEEIVVRDAPWVFIYHPYLEVLRQPWLHGLKLHPVWPMRYERLWMEKTHG
jgi:ABC-type transport system substrate-binding protein